MTKKIAHIFFLMISFLSLDHNEVYAQHCQYDNYSLIGVIPYADNSTTCIDHLRVTLLDQNGNVVGNFWRNDEEDKHFQPLKQTNFLQQYYANSQNHYVFAHRNFNWSSPDTKFTIKIEDTLLQSGEPRYASVLIPLDKKHDNSLCTYGATDNKLPVSYIPLRVQLVPAIKTGSRYTNSTADSVLVLSGDIVFNLTKTVKQSGIDAYGNIFGPYETHRLFSMYHAHSGQLIYTTTAPYNVHLACMDSLEVSDYNFDGYPDLRFCNPPNYEHLYLMYDSEKDTFFYNNLLSSLNEIKIDESKKLITGTYSISDVRYSDMDVKIGTILVAKEYYQLSGEGLKQISKITVHYDDRGKSTKIDTAYYTLINHKLTPIDKETYTSLSQFSAVHIETSVAQVDSMEIIDGTILFKIKIVKPSSYKSGDNSSMNQIPHRIFEMRDIYTNEILYQSQQAYIANMPCMDSIEINDFNFDNKPDLRYCNGYNGSVYMVFDSAKNTFILEPLLSKLENVTINWHDAIVEGVISYYHTDFRSKYAVLVHREYYRLCGTGLKHVEKKTEYYNKRGKITSTLTEYFIYENYTLYPTDTDYCFDLPGVVEESVNQLTHPILISKESGSIRAELTHVLTDQYLWTDTSKQTQNLTIWLNQQSTAVFDLRFSAATGGMDTMEIGAYNFDQVPDILIYKKSDPTQKKYFLSYTDELNVIGFYQDVFMSNIADLEIDSTNQIISGYNALGLDTTYYTFKGVQMDTLILKDKFISVPQLSGTKILRYEKGKLINLNLPSSSFIRIEDGKEFADFNFDGFEDYRMATEREGQYNYYCYDLKNGIYVFNEVLSQMQSTAFDWENKRFYGMHNYTIDGSVYADRYELREGQITVVERMISYKTDNAQSEQRYQEVYVWKDGKLVLFSSGTVE